MSDGGKRRTLPDWMRARMSDGQRFLVLCIFVGLCCGLAAVVFHLAIDKLFHGLWGLAKSLGGWQFMALMIGAPTFAGLVVGLAVRYIAPDAAGSGIPQAKAAYYNRGGKVHGMAGFWRFLLGSLRNFRIGREGKALWPLRGAGGAGSFPRRASDEAAKTTAGQAC